MNKDNYRAVTFTQERKNLVILGMHRSGTSMISGALVRCGLYAGIQDELLSAGVDNPRGFWERLDVVELNEKLLSAVNSSWFQPAPVAKQEVAEIRQLIESLSSRSPWLLKDPRLIFAWPAWASALKTAAKLFVYRAPLPVAASLRARHGFPLEYGLDLWELYNRQAMQIMQAEGGTLIHYEAFSYEQRSAWEELSKRLGAIGVPIDLVDAGADYDQQLDHSRAEQVDESRLTVHQSRLHQVLLQACESDQLPKRLPAQSPNLAQRVRGFGQAFDALADVSELRAALGIVTSERDQARQHFNAAQTSLHDNLAYKNKELERKEAKMEAVVRELAESLRAQEAAGQELRLRDKKLAENMETVSQLGEALLAAGRELADTCHAEETTRQELSLRDKKLAECLETERQLAAKSDYLFSILNTVYLKLLAYRKTPLGKLTALIAMLYKLATLRPRSETYFETILIGAQKHVSEYTPHSLLSRQSRTDLVFKILAYMVRNPMSTIRSASWPRFKRAVSVFFGTSRIDLEVWIQQRFPKIDGFVIPEFKPELEPPLDSLEFAFPKSEQPRVSIVIPVYNEYRMTVFCLQSLLSTTAGVDYELILADDASSDLTSTITERIKGIEIVRADENKGYVINCCNSVCHTRSEYLLFLNNDTAFTQDWLSHLVDTLDADPSAGIVGPMLLFGNGQLQEAGGIIWDDASGWNFGRMDDPSGPEYNYLKEVDYISGACLLIRRALWDEVDGFDQRYAPAYYEDTDLCFKVRAAGYKVLYQPKSRIYHYEGVSNGTDLSSGIKKHQLINKEKFLKKWATTLVLENFPNAQWLFLAKDRSRNRRTVLIIDHYVPSYDKDAGSRSTWLYLQLMVEMGYNVKFVGANFFPHQPYTKELQSMGVEVLVGEKVARNFPTWLQENAKCIDVIYVHRPHVAEQFLSYLRNVNPRPKMIYFGHDLHFMRMEREYLFTGNQKHRDQSEKWKQRELAIFESFDKVYFPSLIEVERVAEIAPAVDVSAIPLYVMERSEVEPYSWQDRVDILFVAGFNHSPNIDAVCWFVKEILPLVVAACPDIKLNVVGSNTPDSVKALAGKHVIVHGYLSDDELAERYRQTRMVAVPLRFGAGVKGKILEAMQHGVPLVTTAIGAEGFAEPNIVFNIKETPADFAQELIEIEHGCSARLRKLDHYAEYLARYFSKSRAREILLRDFGHPRIAREWL